MSKGYVFQPSFLELLETFTRPVDRDALNMAIHRFMFKGEEPVFKNMELKRAWIGLYPYLAKSRKTSLTMSRDSSSNLSSNSKDTSEQSSNNLGRNFEDTSKILRGNSEDTSKKLLSRDKDKEKDIEKEKDKEKKSAKASSLPRFVKPTVEQIKQYISEKGYHFDAESFFAYYESKGWKVGNSPMKDWKAACVTWEKREPHTEQKEEVQKEYHPITPLTKCKVCGSRNVVTRGMYANCLNGDCYASFVWSSSAGDWREE